MSFFDIWTRDAAVVHTASQLAAVQTSCTRLERFPLRRLRGNTATQLVRVPSTATASGITTDAQVVQMQVGTLRVMASPAPTRGRERVAQVVDRGGRCARR